VDSSNNYAMAKLHAGMVKHGTTFLAHAQTAGKGQRGKQWTSTPGQNITMSSVFALPHSFSAATLIKLQSFPFLFSAAAALSCYDFIKACGVHDISIKWPNDLYIGDRKAGGILIENSYQSEWQWSVVGIGINLNQTTFDVPNGRPISLANITGTDYNVRKKSEELASLLFSRIQWLDTASAQEIMLEYNSRLYKRGDEVRLKKGSATFTTTLLHVDTQGKLHTSDVMHREFTIGEVEMFSV
jgi:BirA family biotin operon repressor/biotin-[acetyl-CoA-carboxylase] ligase